MKALFDTNVLLDVLLDREPFSSHASNLFTEVESGNLGGYVCATTLTTIYYLATKRLGHRKANEQVGILLKLFEVAPVNRLVLESALSAGLSDFEDGVLMTAAHHAGMDALITRNQRDFKDSPLPVYSPEEFLKILKSN